MKVHSEKGVSRFGGSVVTLLLAERAKEASVFLLLLLTGLI